MYLNNIYGYIGHSGLGKKKGCMFFMKNWSALPLMDLVEYIEKHHLILKEKLVEVSQLMEQVVLQYGDKHADTVRALQDFFKTFKPGMEKHFDKEENILIPYIRQMDVFSRTGINKPDFHYSSIKNPISLIEYEHVNVENVSLYKLRTITGNYKLPSDVDDDFKHLYDGLKYIEKELHEHINLENNILFPKVIEMELSLMHK